MKYLCPSTSFKKIKAAKMLDFVFLVVHSGRRDQLTLWRSRLFGSFLTIKWWKMSEKNKYFGNRCFRDEWAILVFQMESNCEPLSSKWAETRFLSCYRLLGRTEYPVCWERGRKTVKTTGMVDKLLMFFCVSLGHHKSYRSFVHAKRKFEWSTLAKAPIFFLFQSLS